MAQVRDPVCGMFIESNTAAETTHYQTMIYYFCSPECLREFESNPQLYVQDEEVAGIEAAGVVREDIEEEVELEKHEPPRTTIGKITSPKFGSAGSGGAEYEPIPERHTDEEALEIEKKRSKKTKR
jgi:YHS domain-containing protein